MRLKNIKIFPNEAEGLESDLLSFSSNNITHLYGSNGSGKTPIIQSIVYCLGYPSVFRDDIYQNCDYVVLTVTIQNRELRLKRMFEKNKLNIQVFEENKRTQDFLDEKEYSAFIFELIKQKVNKLISTHNKLTFPYLSSMIPIYYLDQDEGYNEYYSPPSKFVKDQFSEMIRMIFNLPVKNSFDEKKEKLQAKEELDYLDKEVEQYFRTLEVAQNSTSVVTKNLDEISNNISILETEVENLKSSSFSYSDSVKAIDQLIATHNGSIRTITFEMNEISKRNKGINQIIEEINTEIETLSLNEEARRIFLSFEEICSSSQCQLFSKSSESYSKNLLYLKDQIKDLERNTKIDNIKYDQLHQSKKDLEKLVESILYERNNSNRNSDLSSFVNAISDIKNQIMDLQIQRSEIEKILLLENKYYQVLSKRNKAFETYQSFSTTKVSNPEIIKLRMDLKKSFLKWLDILNINNIKKEITFQDDFIPVLGTETISQLKGSTRTRAILAFHAALIEVIANYDIDTFRFFILDTPKQQEMQERDLEFYLKELKQLSNKNNIQIVFSTTEYHYEGDTLDQEWTPLYQGEKQKMFLRPSVTRKV